MLIIWLKSIRKYKIHRIEIKYSTCETFFGAFLANLAAKRAESNDILSPVAPVLKIENDDLLNWPSK